MCIVLILISYKFISKTKALLGNFSELNTDEINKYLNKLRLYPIIQLVTAIPIAAHRIFQLYNSNFYLWAEIAQIVFDSLRGILFVILFLLSPGVLKSVFKSKVKIRKNSSSNKKNLNSTFLLLEGSFISNHDFESTPKSYDRSSDTSLN